MPWIGRICCFIFNINLDMYLNKKIFNKTQLALACGMRPKLFHRKLNNIKYNKFNEEELKVIHEEMANQIRAMNEPLRILLIEFSKDLGTSAIELIKMEKFEYVVDHYIYNNIENHGNTSNTGTIHK